MFNKCSAVDCFTNPYSKICELNIDELLSIIVCRLYNLNYVDGQLHDPKTNQTHPNAAHIVDINNEDHLNNIISILIKRHWIPAYPVQEDGQWKFVFELLDSDKEVCAVSIGVSEHRIEALLVAIATVLVGGFNTSFFQG